MELITRLSLMFTVYNLAALCIFQWSPPWLQELTRANSLLILIAMILVWTSGHIIEVYRELQASIGITLPLPVIAVIDILVHVGPVLLLSMPDDPLYVAAAFALLCTWYVLVRNKIGEIYAPSVPADWAVIGTGLFALVYGCSLLDI